MGAEKYGFFFFLLSKILSVKCLENNPTESILYHGQNTGTSNSWPVQPDQSVPQGMTNYLNSINPNFPQNDYFNNNNQQYSNYHQQSSVPQHYISPQEYNSPLQSNMPLQYGQKQLQPMHQPVNHQKNQNQQSQVPLSYNLHSPPQGNGQGVSHTLGTIGPSLKEHQKQLSTSMDQPITQSLPNFGQVINNAKNQENLPPSPLPSIPPVPNQSQSPQIPLQLSSNTLVEDTSIPNGNNKQIKEEEELPDFLPRMNNVKVSGNLPPSIPPILNPSQLPQIPLQLSSNTLVEDTSIPNGNNKQIKEDSELPDFDQVMNSPKNTGNEDILIDNSQSDIQTFLNSENNDKSNPLDNAFKNQDDSQFVSNDAAPQLPINVQVENVIINPQLDSKISDSSSNEHTENLQNALDLLPPYFENTKLNEESKLEKAISESLVSSDNDKIENNELYSLENLTFDKPPTEWESLSKYDESYIANTKNSEKPKENNAKSTVFANPNDIHILQQSPKQSSTNVNSYPNNNVLNTSLTDMSLWYVPPFPNSVDYVQPFNSNAYKQPISSLLGVNQNSVAYNQIPMYLDNSNYYNQQVDSTPGDQNQMIFKIQSPGLSLNTNQPSYVDGSIYKKVDLRNPPPNVYNSWVLPKKDYTKNLRPNQNNGNTNYNGNTRTSDFEIPLSSYQTSIQGVFNSPSNDMFVQNMLYVISNSVQAPLDGTKAIFDITRANFPRSPLSHVIRLTHTIVRSVMLNLQQTLNTVMNTLYGRRAKRDLNPSDVLYNLPGALVNKYSDQSAAPQKMKNTNLSYYNQPTIAGQKLTVDYSVSQPATENSRADKDYYVPQSANIQNYVLNSLADAVTSAVRSNIPDPYSMDSPEVKQYTQQVIVIVEIVFKNQIDNILRGQSPKLNMY